MMVMPAPIGMSGPASVAPPRPPPLVPAAASGVPPPPVPAAASGVPPPPVPAVASPPAPVVPALAPAAPVVPAVPDIGLAPPDEQPAATSQDTASSGQARAFIPAS